MNNYQQVTKTHIQQLKEQGCSSSDWSQVFFTNDSDLQKLKNVQFSGTIKLGSIEGVNTAFGGVKRKNGIYNTHLHNCEIGKNPFIKETKNYIANYIIGNNVVIENIGHIAVEGISTFGNGTSVETINEGGGREIPIYDNLSAQVAYILALYRHRDKLITNLKKMISSYTASVKSDRGNIGNNVKISNCKFIQNVNIGPNTKIEGASTLKNGSLNSFEDAPIFIGSEVMAENFIISSNTKIDNATIISNCFVGEGCVLDKHYSAEHSVFFCK